jgi:hypothetical protein
VKRGHDFGASQHFPGLKRTGGVWDRVMGVNQINLELFDHFDQSVDRRQGRQGLLEKRVIGIFDLMKVDLAVLNLI